MYSNKKGISCSFSSYDSYFCRLLVFRTYQQIITILIVIAGTMLTRFLPFFIFPAGKPTPKYIQYLGKALPAAIFGMLVIYCLKNINLLDGSHGIPEAISILLVIVLHLWKRQMLLSIAGGTICYMLLVQFLF